MRFSWALSYAFYWKLSIFPQLNRKVYVWIAEPFAEISITILCAAGTYIIRIVFVRSEFSPKFSQKQEQFIDFKQKNGYKVFRCQKRFIIIRSFLWMSFFLVTYSSNVFSVLLDTKCIATERTVHFLECSICFLQWFISNAIWH